MLYLPSTGSPTPRTPRSRRADLSRAPRAGLLGRLLVLAAAALLAGACDDGGSSTTGGDTTPDDAATAADSTATTDDVTGDDAATDATTTDATTDATAGDADDATSTSPDASDGDDADVSLPLESLDEAYGDCRTPGAAGRTGSASGPGRLVRVDVDTSAFPDALCNDGSPAVFFAREATDPSLSDVWVIHLQGGGSCARPEACATRYCSVDTNFGGDKMTSLLAPTDGTPADGVNVRDPAISPFGGANQVFVHYCSSDAWSGTARDVEIVADHPVTGEPHRATIHFLGHRILEAVVRTLRQDGVPATTLDVDGVTESLPDLDDARLVVLAGGSAGGNGVTRNLDWFAEEMAANCSATAECRVFGIVDSITSPSNPALIDLSTSTRCTEIGQCTYEELYQYAWNEQYVGMYGAPSDTSCVEWHAANEPGSEWKCADTVHVQEHHVTTPALYRMGLTDSLIFGNLTDAGITAADGRPLDEGCPDACVFSELVAAELTAIADGGEERSAPMSVFGPRCQKHETLGNTRSAWETTIRFNNNDVSMRTLIERFLIDGSTATVISQDGSDTTCP